jgi:hypothetical protein
MRKFEIYDKLIEIAKKRAKDIGILNRSITQGEGNIVGIIGEFLSRHVYGGVIHNTYDYDIVLPDGRTADVKTKKNNSRT